MKIQRKYLVRLAWVLGLLGVFFLAIGLFGHAPTGSMHEAREDQTATLLPDGEVLVAGGCYEIAHSRGGAPSLSSAEVFDPVQGVWRMTHAMNVARNMATATLLPNGKVLVVGYSRSSDPATTRPELYDPATETWTKTSAMNEQRQHHTATLLPNGKVLVVGGVIGVNPADVELYDPVTGIWTVTGAMSQPHMDHTATLLPDGKVLVAGGQDPGGSGVLASAEVYDPTSGTWTATGSMNHVRGNHTATLLSNGKVLVIGGEDFGIFGGGILSSAELYDPATGKWTATGSLNEGHRSHTATLLPGGKVLVAGGMDHQPDRLVGASAELYDPVTGTWSMTGRMNDVRVGQTATLLPNGKVLVAGGRNDGGLMVSLHNIIYQIKITLIMIKGSGGMTVTPDILTNTSTELYDPATGTWSYPGGQAVSSNPRTAGRGRPAPPARVDL